MTTARARPWVRSLMFIAANATVLAVAWFAAIGPVVDALTEREEQIQTRSEHLGRLRAIVGRDVAMHSADGERKLGSLNDEFLRGPNAGAVSANLQADLRGLAQSSGAQIRSVQALPLRTIGEVSYAGAQVELSGSLEAIQKTASKIETTMPFLFIASGSIRPIRAADLDASRSEPAFESSFDVYAALSGPVGHE